MDEKKQQIEALEVAGSYCEKLLNGINNVVKELEGERQPDTDEYLKTIINGINWVFEVYNGTKDLIGSEGIVIDIKPVNDSVALLNEAEKDNDDAKRVKALSGGILTFINEIKAAADRITE